MVHSAGFRPYEPAHVVHQPYNADLCFGPRHANRVDELAAHWSLLEAAYMLNANPNFLMGLVNLDPLCAQRFAPFARVIGYGGYNTSGSRNAPLRQNHRRCQPRHSMKYHPHRADHQTSGCHVGSLQKPHIRAQIYIFDPV